jgi:heme-degrading monooxygenase HmoA
VILEVADIRIAPGRQADFEAALVHGVESVISKAEGFRTYSVVKGIESPERYLLMVWWETLEHHTVEFRQGPLFAAWRAIVGPYFATPPAVEHYSRVAEAD